MGDDASTSGAVCICNPSGSDIQVQVANFLHVAKAFSLVGDALQFEGVARRINDN